MAREKVKTNFNILEEDGKIFSIRTDEFNFLDSDGYETLMTRKMSWKKEALETEINRIREDIEEKATEIEKGKGYIKQMEDDLKPIQELRQWKQVKENWEVYKIIYGGIEKERKYLNLQTKIEMDKKSMSQDQIVLKHYEELLPRLKDESN